MDKRPEESKEIIGVNVKNETDLMLRIPPPTRLKQQKVYDIPGDPVAQQKNSKSSKPLYPVQAGSVTIELINSEIEIWCCQTQQ